MLGLLGAALGAAMLLAAGRAAAADPEPSWQLVEPAYETIDTFVAAYSVRDFGATGDGVTDVTELFQQLLDALGRLGGGTLFVPEGKYVLRGNLEVPKGVTIRGEWSKPAKGEPIQGTILMVYAGRGDAEARPFMTMVTSSAVRDIAIWYPEQLPDDIVPYPPAIEFGKPNYFGNEFANAKNITLVNAYSGVVFSRTNGGTAPVINGIYGTPLSRGVEIDNIVDVGRIEWIDFSPLYWAGSGLPNSPAPGSAYADWIYENGTGVVMRRNDWSYTGYITVEGYHIGFHAGLSVTSPGALPNGHNYMLRLINCKTGIWFDGVSDVGIMFTRVQVEGSETAVHIAAESTGVLQLLDCELDASAKAIDTAAGSAAKVLMQQCAVHAGAIAMEGGTLVAADSDFNNAAPQVELAEEARGSIVGNRFKTAADIANRSRYITIIDHTPIETRKLPDFPVTAPETRKPARMALYVATDAPFHAKADGVTDNTAAIQAALDEAAADGGGIVFLPPGKYKVLGHLTVPSGVELKGSVDNSTTPTGPGSVLEVYAGRGEQLGEPFLKLSGDSGIRGLTFNYPEQMAEHLPNMAPYPYAIQVTGKDAYIVNIALRAVYNGIDLFTYRADRPYIDFVAGHVFKNGLRMGGGTTGGKVYNLQFNLLAYAAGQETKFGVWPNSPKGSFDPVYEYGAEHLDFMILGDARELILYNNFHYGSYRGMLLAAENGTGPSGLSLGLGIDGSTKAMSYEATGEGGFHFINTQLVSIGAREDTRYIETLDSFAGESTFYSVDMWGHPLYGLDIGGGEMRFLMGNFHNPGTRGFATLQNGRLYLDTSVVGGTPALLNREKEAQLYIQSSIVSPTGVNFRNLAAFTRNLTTQPLAAPASSASKEQSSPPPTAEAGASGDVEESAASHSGHNSSGAAPWLWAAVAIAAAAAAGTAGYWLYRRSKKARKLDA